MKYFIDQNDNYRKILDLLCQYKGIGKADLIQILKDQECKYLLFLLLRKYNCLDYDTLKKDFDIKSKKTVNTNMKRAEEKLLLNKKIREMYFEAEDILEKLG